MDAVEGWNACASGQRYDPTAPHAWRKGWRWHQAETFTR
jgi:hypothetical protein